MPAVLVSCSSSAAFQGFPSVLINPRSPTAIAEKQTQINAQEAKTPLTAIIT
jgi:hypothetical protein